MNSPRAVRPRTPPRRRCQGEDGVSMVVVILISTVLLSIATAMVGNALGEMNRASRERDRSSAYQAAEAGVEDYVAKLTEDHTYYLHHVHPGESTRANPGGTRFAAGAVWDGSATWTYPLGRNAWRSLGNGFEFNLNVSPPSGDTGGLRIAASGRKQGSTTVSRTIEMVVRPASVADFQMLSNSDISYGTTATTRGKIYVGIDDLGVAHNITHAGTAYSNLYAENNILRAPTYRDGARGYNRTNIRTVIRNPVNFNSFTSSLVDIKEDANLTGGILLDDASAAAWSITFNGGGTVAIAKCTKTSGLAVELSTPTCGAATTKTIPPSGVIYANQTAIVKGVVKGTVSLGSNDDIVVGGNISYGQAGRDVLGLIAKNDVILPQWSASSVTWSAAVVAQNGMFRSASSDGSKDTMTFNGSVATNLGGYMGMFDVRNYNYDNSLLLLQPPHLPILEEAFTTVLFRELNAGAA